MSKYNGSLTSMGQFQKPGEYYRWHINSRNFIKELISYFLRTGCSMWSPVIWKVLYSKKWWKSGRTGTKSGRKHICFWNQKKISANRNFEIFWIWPLELKVPLYNKGSFFRVIIAQINVGRCVLNVLKNKETLLQISCIFYQNRKLQTLLKPYLASLSETAFYC